jgi:hypothetical protein
MGFNSAFRGLISILQQFLILSTSKITEGSKLCDAHCMYLKVFMYYDYKNSSINGQDTDSCMYTVELIVLTVV